MHPPLQPSTRGPSRTRRCHPERVTLRCRGLPPPLSARGTPAIPPWTTRQCHSRRTMHPPPQPHTHRPLHRDPSIATLLGMTMLSRRVGNGNGRPPGRRWGSRGRPIAQGSGIHLLPITMCDAGTAVIPSALPFAALPFLRRPVREGPLRSGHGRQVNATANAPCAQSYQSALRSSQFGFIDSISATFLARR